MLKGRVLLTGGSGTLGRAIIKRANDEKWDCEITMFSRDVMKHHRIKNDYPHIHSIIGDIRDFTTLSNAMVGQDCVLHLAAVKHIPDSEFNSIDTYEINVGGSLNVCIAAMQLGTPHVLGISTDKSAHPANAYGASKYLMEKIFAEYSRLGLSTQFHLVRYGNVLESTGSVIEAWKKSVAAGQPINITDPAMTRFWLSPSQAVDLVLASLEGKSGHIHIAKMPALSIGKLAEYVLGKDYKFRRIPLRPGEKMHETLLTIDEAPHAFIYDDHFILPPSTDEVFPYHIFEDRPYSSDVAPELTKDDLMDLLNG